MKLLTYDAGAGPAPAYWSTGGWWMLRAAWPRGPLRDVQALLELPDAPLTRLRAALERGVPERLPLDSVRLRAPILQPPTVRDHIAFEEHATAQYTRETDSPRMEVWARLPIFYFSNPLRIMGPDEVVPMPAATKQLDYECELAAVIAREGSNILEADALEYVAGFTIFNDWSCRDLQSDESQFGLGRPRARTRPPRSARTSSRPTSWRRI